MPAGSKPGERRGGRKKGTPNKATAEIKELARKHAPLALATLARIAGDKDASQQAQVAASNSILDRAYGKPAQAVTGADGGPMQLIVSTGIDRSDA